MAKDTKYLILLSLLYFIVGFIGILHHELWLDEAHHWLLARDSTSVSDLMYHTRQEGHPLLWSFMLYGLSRYTANPFWMQLLHLLVATSAVVVFLRKAPFNWVFKTLFIFGYFMIFEYNLISRNYSLGVFFLFLACSFFEKRVQNFTALCLCLGLALHTHLIFSIAAIALFLTLLAEQLQNGELFKKNFLPGYLIFAAGLLLLFIQYKNTDSGWLLHPIQQLPFKERLSAGVGSLFKGWFAIPDFRSLHFWNSNLIVNLSKPIAGFLAVLACFTPLLLFFKNRKTLFFFYAVLMGAQVFFFVTQRSATRFHGMLYIAAIMALWMESYYAPEGYRFRFFLNSLRLTMLRKPIIYGILILHFVAGVYAYAMDYRFPFTSAKESTDFVKKEGKAHTEIVTVSCDGTLLSAYLEKKILFLCEESLQSYCHWDSACHGTINQAEIGSRLSGYIHKGNKNVYYISYYPLTGKPVIGKWIALTKNTNAKLLKKFDRNIVRKTNYYVYEVAPTLP